MASQTVKPASLLLCLFVMLAGRIAVAGTPTPSKLSKQWVLENTVSIKVMKHDYLDATRQVVLAEMSAKENPKYFNAVLQHCAPNKFPLQLVPDTIWAFTLKDGSTTGVWYSEYYLTFSDGNWDVPPEVRQWISDQVQAHPFPAETKFSFSDPTMEQVLAHAVRIRLYFKGSDPNAMIDMSENRNKCIFEDIIHGSGVDNLYSPGLSEEVIVFSFADKSEVQVVYRGGAMLYCRTGINRTTNPPTQDYPADDLPPKEAWRIPDEAAKWLANAELPPGKRTVKVE